MAGTIDWDAVKDRLTGDPDYDGNDSGELSIDSFHAEHRGITVAELRAERDAARAERRAEFEAALEEAVTAAWAHGQRIERLGWQLHERVATDGGIRAEEAEKQHMDAAKARVLALWDAKEA